MDKRKTPTGTAVLVFVCVSALLVSFVVLSYSKWYLFDERADLPSWITLELEKLGSTALESGDVPIAAVLLYDDTIIGNGYNTVLRDGNAGGHAEINAISDALTSLGVQNFSALNRNSLLLISTFEPCPMCRGAILEYRIKRVVFLKPKPIMHLLTEDLRSLLYQWRRQQREPSTLQDSLFRRHPAFRADH